MFEIYTDGSCIGNPWPGSRGWICYQDEKEISHGRGKSPMTTNNQMELEAVINAMKYLRNQKPVSSKQNNPFELWWIPDNSSLLPVTIVTDSSYVYEGVTKYLDSWKKRGRRLANKRPLKNLEQWIALAKLLESGILVQRKRVRWHADDRRNNQVDRMIRSNK